MSVRQCISLILACFFNANAADNPFITALIYVNQVITDAYFTVVAFRLPIILTLVTGQLDKTFHLLVH